MLDWRFLRLVVLLPILLFPPSLLGQAVTNLAAAGGSMTPNVYTDRNLEVNVRTADGKPVETQVLVQLITLGGQLYLQTTARNGQARFNNLSKEEFKILVTAPGFQRTESHADLTTKNLLTSVDVQLIPISDTEDAASARGMSAMSPKAQRELSRAMEVLNGKKPADARSHLETAAKAAPENAEVEYVYGIYYSRMSDPAQAVTHWERALAENPNHLSTLLELSQELLHENKGAEAAPYLQRALKIDPSSWRAHAFSAEAAYLMGHRDDAIKHAERALELGHDRAAAMQPFLAGVLFENGDTERAIKTMQAYVKANPKDAEAAKQLEEWKHPAPAAVSAPVIKKVAPPPDPPVLSNWMPPDVDEKIPPVESNAVCSMEELRQKAGERLVALVQDIDRFTATEWIVDETIKKYGMPSGAEKEKFGYTVSIHEIRPGMLSVDEYRSNEWGHTEFPDGIITTGLPALVLIFHPFYADNFEMTCEGLAQSSSGLAWQVHFRQRPDRPIALRGFRVGTLGSLHPAALKGRAWIAADSYQIVRLETDLVAPIPEIKLVAEHIALEYQAVNFQKQKVDLWLPHSAEVHFDWRGQRVHRRHAFDNYLLFSIDANERIGGPKEGPPPPATGLPPSQTPPHTDIGPEPRPPQ